MTSNPTNPTPELRWLVKSQLVADCVYVQDNEPTLQQRYMFDDGSFAGWYDVVTDYE